jgi:peptidyl-prolyl cis-trans isomerase SurA
MVRIGRYALTVSTVLILGCVTSNQTSKQLQNDTVIAEVKGKTIYLSELYHQFNRTSVQSDNSEAIDYVSELSAFLPLYVDYRAKLESAKDAGLFTDSEIIQELSSYELQTAFPYWLENKIKADLLNELDERSKIELNASHILITLPNNPTPSDTLRVYNRLIDARTQALAGADFDSLSSVYSSVQNGRSIGGPLGYFSGGWAVKEFEDVAYALSKDQISMPFRTQFGYHIIKLHDQRPSSPDRLVSHVFLRVSSEDQLDEVLEQALVGFNEYNAGVIDWANFVQNYSQDPQSGPVEGRIGWVNHGRYDARFTDVVMNIEKPGDITEPFFSGYGVHVVKLDSIKTYATEEQRLIELNGRLQALPRFRNNRSYTLKSVRNSGIEVVHNSTLSSFESLLQEHKNVPYASVPITDEVMKQPVYSLNNSTHTLGEYLEWIINNTDATSSNNYLYSYRDEFFNAMAEKQIVPVTKQVFPEFGKLSQEYLNGLVIFKISEDSIWNYSKIDTARVYELYEANKDTYNYDTRYFYTRISAINDSLTSAARMALTSGIPQDSVRRQLNGVVIRDDVVSDISEAPFSYLSGLEVGESTQTFDYRNRPTAFILNKIDLARPMSFDEAFFRVVSEYQPIREKEWLNRLRSLYQVQSFPEAITQQNMDKLLRN